jgi:hypothetical protein
VTPASLFLGPGELAPVIVSFRPGSDGTKSGTLSITSNDPDEPMTTVSLHGTGRQPPQIAVASAALSEAAHPGEKQTRTLSIVNEGESALRFDVSSQKAQPAASSGRKKIVPRQENSAAMPGSGVLPAAHASASYSGRRAEAAASPRVIRRNPQAAGAHGLKVLALFTGEPFEILDPLTAYPDIAAVDGFNAEYYVPTLADLLHTTRCS